MSNNKKNYLLTNMISYAMLQIVNLVVGLFLPRLYLAVYGSDINGIISTVNSFTSYFSYLEAGLGLTLIHSLFKPLAENNTQELNGVLAYSKRRYRNISFVYFILVVGLSLIFPLLNPTDAMGTPEFIFLVLVIGTYGALDFFTMSKYRVLLTADRKEYVISNAMLIAQIGRVIFTWIMLQFEMSVVFVKLIPIFTLLIRSFILHTYIKSKYKEVDYNSNEKVSIDNSTSHWDAMLLQISISTSVSLPTILISQALDYRNANIYAVYSMVISAMVSITSSLSSGVAPSFGRSIAKGERINKKYEIFDFVVAIVLSIVFSVTAVMLLPFIKMYTNVVDDINYIHPIYAVLMSVFGALYAYRIPITAVVNAAGEYSKYRVHNVINLCIQVVGGVIGVVFFGIPGVIIVMIVASLHRNIALTKVNSKFILNSTLRSCILNQLLIVVLVAGSFVVSNGLISNIDFNIWLWIGVSILVAILEMIVCSIIFSLVTPKSAVALMRGIKAFILKKNKV